MPIKRRDREAENGTKNYRIDHIPTDHELFLQAFEKPTQIYRYLRSRHTLSPIFLHRNLTYMKERMSRKHNRKEFRTDLLLLRNNLEAEKTACPNKFLTFMFLGVYNKSMLEEQFVEVEIVLSKISHMKRKDSIKATQDALGTIIVKINPLDMIGKIPAISIPTDVFKPAGTGSINRSCILQMNVTVLPHFESLTEPMINITSRAVRTFETELLIFDKQNRCSLSDGEYELTLNERINSSPKNFSPKKHPTWEVIPENCLDEFNKVENPLNDFTKCPLLKFRLAWTKDKFAELVDRPLPITIRKEDHFISNKENDPIPNQNQGSSENCAAQLNGVNVSTNATASDTIVTIPITRNSNINNNNSNSNSNSNSNNNNNINNINNNNLSNNSNSNSSTAIVKLHDIASRIIYHFIYNNNSSQQTETCDNFNCPWCCLHCLTLYSLLKHLKLCHARFNFTYVPMPNGVRVDVSINELFDGSYIGSPHDLVGPAGSAFAKAGPVRRTVVTRILVCRPHRPKHSLTEFLEIDENELNSQRPYITGHNRLYHHTLTCLPVHPKGIDIDSEGENDPAWLQHKTLQMIDEFTDVNEGEKELMKMWNLHIMRNGYVGDIQIPLACEMFLDIRGKELLMKNLYKNFVLHMCNLSDYGLITPDILYKTIQKLQRMLSTYAEGREILTDGREKQLDYWLKFGVHKQKEIQSQHSTQTQKRKLSQSMGNDSFAKSKAMSNEDQNGDDIDALDCDKNDELHKMKQRDTKTRYDFNDHKLMAAVVPVLKRIQTKTDANNSETSLKRRKSTILPAKEESRLTGTVKRKASQTRGESPPRRRSSSAALQSSIGSSAGANVTSTRQNSSTLQTDLAKKRKRSPDLPKYGK